MTERIIAPISRTELNRRWDTARAIMRAGDVDALVMQNANDWLGGYVRWFTDAPANNAYPRSVVFFHDGMTVVEQGPFEGETRPDPDGDAFPGVTRFYTTPSYVTAGYTGGYDAALIARALTENGCRRIGWVNPVGAYLGFGRALEAALPGAVFLDVTDQIDAVKAVKSAEEQALIRQTTALQDAVMSKVAEFIRPGQKDFEIAAFAQYQAQLLGAEQGIFLNSSAPAGKAAVFRPRHQMGRTIENGDVFTLLVETNGPGGFYTEIGRAFVLGRAPKALTDGIAFAVDAQQATLRNLVPGARCAAVADAHDHYMAERGFGPERRLYAHGQGYDMVERPLIRRDETMSISAGMNIVVHPGYTNDEAFATICDNYLIGSDGPSECLHRTPKQVFEL